VLSDSLLYIKLYKERHQFSQMKPDFMSEFIERKSRGALATALAIYKKLLYIFLNSLQST